MTQTLVLLDSDALDGNAGHRADYVGHDGLIYAAALAFCKVFFPGLTSRVELDLHMFALVSQFGSQLEVLVLHRRNLFLFQFSHDFLQA